MKYTIEGFSQKYAITLRRQVERRNRLVEVKIDCTDLVILRWFVDFYPKMKKHIIDGKEYAWLTHGKLLTDLPIIDISKSAFISRMQKLVDFKILDYKFIKTGGTYSLYTFGENYVNLIDNKEGTCSNIYGVHVQTCTGVDVQTHTKDKSINNKINNNKVSKGRAFTPPTFEEVEEYAISRGYPNLAKKFFEYYTTGDWRDSKGNKIKNWKQKFITWEGERTQAKKPEPKNSTMRAYSKTELQGLFKSVDEMQI